MPLRLIAPLMLLASLAGFTARTPRPAGAISGKVTDRSALELPGVEIKLSGPEGLSRTEFSDPQGNYRFNWLPNGTYALSFALSGFKTAVRKDIAVPSASSDDVNAVLEVAAPAPGVVICSDCGGASVVKTTIVRLETPLGSIDIEVDELHAPVTAANFLKYVDAGLYNNGRFHRATRAENYVVNLPNRPLLECIQAGINPDRRNEGFPPIPLERTTVTGLKHVVGTVSMARAPAADTATSDFFILLNDQPSLDSGGKRFDDAQGAAAFGRVVAGMDVVRKIQQQPVEAQRLTPPITITSAARVK